MKKINVLSLFDGVSCGQIALNRAGIEYNKYYASEIDKFSMKVTQNNYPNTIQLGDVKNLKKEDIPDKIDLLIGGSPCTDFSFSGKRKGMSTQDNIEITSLDQYLELKENGFEFYGQSYLFWEYIRLWKELKPKYFLLENVLMVKKWKDLITRTIGTQSFEINSSLVSSQNRLRLYWTNIPNQTYPKDKGILLKDIVEDEVDNNVKCGGIRGRNPDNPKSRKAGLPTQQMLELRKDDKTNCLTTVQKDNVIVKGFENYKSGKSIKRIIKNKKTLNEKSNCLTSSSSHNPTGCGASNISIDNITWRILTPLECERLQTVPDNYTSSVSKNQRYKMLGNGWTVDIISHIFEGLKGPRDGLPIFKEPFLF